MQVNNGDLYVRTVRASFNLYFVNCILFLFLLNFIIAKYTKYVIYFTLYKIYAELYLYTHILLFNISVLYFISLLGKPCWPKISGSASSKTAAKDPDGNYK